MITLEVGTITFEVGVTTYCIPEHPPDYPSHTQIFSKHCLTSHYTRVGSHDYLRAEKMVWWVHRVRKVVRVGKGMQEVGVITFEVGAIT